MQRCPDTSAGLFASVAFFVVVRVCACLQSAPDVSITKSPTSGSVPVGGTFTYNITVRNSGSAAATNVTVVDVLPPGLQFAPSWTPPSGE